MAKGLCPNFTPNICRSNQLTLLLKSSENLHKIFSDFWGNIH